MAGVRTRLRRRGRGAHGQPQNKRAIFAPPHGGIPLLSCQLAWQSGAAAFSGEERGKPRWTNPVSRVHDGQWGFCYTRALVSVTAENRAFEEKQPLDLTEKDSEARCVCKRRQTASCSRESVPNPDNRAWRQLVEYSKTCWSQVRNQILIRTSSLQVCMTMRWRRRWREGSQNTALWRFEELNEL